MIAGPLKALQEIVDRIGQQIRLGQVVTAYLAGGMAVYVHVAQRGKLPVEAIRYSEDVDIQFGRSMNIEDDIVVDYRDAAGSEKVLALDPTYSIDIGLRHPESLDDAPHLLDSGNGRLHLHILTALDLAVTKTGRFQDHDREDIRLLARSGLLDAGAFEARAVEAADYLATDPEPVLININKATELIRQSSVPDPHG